MRTISIIFTIIVIILALYYSGEFLAGKQNLQLASLLKSSPEDSSLVDSSDEDSSQKQTTEKQTPTSSSSNIASSNSLTTTQLITIAQSKKSAILIDTRITAGPEEGEIIEETNEVVFEFEAEIFSEKTGFQDYLL